MLPRSFLPSPLLGCAACALLALTRPAASAQTDFGSAITDYFSHWDQRVDAAQASQPGWITPLATTTPRLEQEFRYDQVRESLRNGSTVDLYDNGKGLEFIPTERTEIIVTLPAYEVRGPVESGSGFADWPGVLLKYRVLSANAAAGNYIVTVFAQYGLPTGAQVYTSHNHVFTPTLAAGKGWGDFDLQATLGEAIPTHDNSNAGRTTLTNVTAQYHFANYFWPELEMNRTDWEDGSRHGRSQTFLTPGIVLGRFLLGGRSKLILGVGYQTAVSRVYASGSMTPTYNHAWIVSARTTF